MDYEASMHDVLERLLHDESAEPRELPLSLLRAITNDLADSQKILADGYSTVYKDVLRNGKVAVKKLSRSLQKDMERFENEVGCLMRMRAKHKNIVRFLGYCAESQGTMVEMPTGGSGLVEVPKRLLFFEYPSGGKLDAYITEAKQAAVTMHPHNEVDHATTGTGIGKWDTSAEGSDGKLLKMAS